MRVPVKFFLGLLAAGVLVPIYVLLSWSFAETSQKSSSGPRHVESTTGRKGLDKDLKTRDLAQDVVHAAAHHSGPGPGLGPSQAWKSHVRKACLSLDMVGDPSTLTTAMLKHILVDDKNKLLYCQIPKVATTTWRRVFIALTGKLEGRDPLSISADDAHHKYDNLLSYLSDLPPEGIAQRLRDYFKFVFVREPFERILSAYKNKFAARTHSADYFKWKFGRKIIDQYRRSFPVPKNNTGAGVKFEEFIAYLIDDRKRIMMNEHWEQFFKLCHPCHIDYDYVGKLERMDEDSQYIFDLKQLSDKVKMPSRAASRYRHKETNSFMKEFYSKLSGTTLSRLYNMYMPDFVIFNYTVPSDVKKFM